MVSFSLAWKNTPPTVHASTSPAQYCSTNILDANRKLEAEHNHAHINHDHK